MSTILCLFEQQTVIDELADALTSSHDVEFVRDDSEALQRLRKQAYDVFICPAFFKGATIESLLIRLEWLDLTKRTSVLCVRDRRTPVSAYCDNLLAKTTMALGARGYMSLEKLLKFHKQILPTGVETTFPESFRNDERVRKA